MRGAWPEGMRSVLVVWCSHYPYGSLSDATFERRHDDLSRKSAPESESGVRRQRDRGPRRAIEKIEVRTTMQFDTTLLHFFSFLFSSLSLSLTFLCRLHAHEAKQ